MIANIFCLKIVAILVLTNTFKINKLYIIMVTIIILLTFTINNNNKYFIFIAKMNWTMCYQISYFK